MCYVSSTTDVFNLNFPRVLRNGFLWLCLTRPTSHVGSRCSSAGLVWPGTCVYSRVDASNTFPCVSMYTVAGKCWKKILYSKYPLLNALSIPSHWPRSTDGVRAFDEHTLCINLDCRTLSFQVFEDLHLPVILSNNFSIFSFSHSFSTSAKWSNIIFWIKTCGWRQIPHVTVFHVRLSCLVLSIVPCTSRLAVVVLVVMF